MKKILTNNDYQSLKTKLQQSTSGLVTYFIGINLYFCLWFLGNEGESLVWNHQSLRFNHLWYASNVVLFLVFGLTLMYRTISKNWVWLNAGPVKIDFLIQSLIGTGLFLVLLYHSLLLFPDIEKVALVSYGQTSMFLSFLIYHTVVFSLVIILINLSQSIGGAGLIQRYLFRGLSRPMQVDKGFMFLDLNCSTAIAEQLSHTKYSGLLGDCFAVLEEVVDKFPGISVYQYVGDEAVLHWDYTDKHLCNQLIVLFEEFKVRLDLQSSYFENRYQVKPIFKAAIHGGTVTRSEIGNTPVHLAYHGDVVNTTSRILGICHKHETDLLISASYYERLKKEALADSYKKIEEVVLNGKVHRLTVYKPLKPYFIP
ncbi:MAG: adenylate/guanylate cyclase domain-containing protein, partial [Bacteroidota bacterium]